MLSLSAAASPIVGFISPAGASAGNDLSVSVQATGVVDLYAFQFDLLFDPARLSAVSVAHGTLLGDTGMFLPGIIDNTGGSITFIADTLSGPVAGLTGNGTLAQITFTALTAGTSSLSLANAIFIDSTLADATAGVALADGSVAVSDASGVPEPGSLGLAAAGLAGLWWAWRRSRRWSSALALGLVCCATAARDARAQNLTFVYTGSAFDVSACGLVFDGTSFRTSCKDGQITAAVTFRNVAPNFTGVLQKNAIDSFTLSANGVGNVFTQASAGTCISAAFNVTNGLITSWLFVVHQLVNNDCSAGTGGNIIHSSSTGAPLGPNGVIVYDYAVADFFDPNNIAGAAGTLHVAAGIAAGTWNRTDCHSSDPLFFAKSMIFASVGPVERAVFRPANDCTLADVARAYGFDHFNWINLVVEAPLGMRAICGVGSQRLALPQLDPSPDGQSACLNSNEWADGFDYYWNETNRDGTKPAIEIDGIDHWKVDSKTLVFQDKPGYFEAGPNNVIRFVTSLVGVYSGNSYLPVIAFTWETTWNGKDTGGLKTLSFRNTADPIPGSGTGEARLLDSNTPIGALPLAVRTFLDASGALGIPLGSSIPGDVNADGAANCTDIAIVRASFGKRSNQSGFDFRADVNADAVVDIRDLASVSQRLAAGTRCQ